jgi:hypothetical protein
MDAEEKIQYVIEHTEVLRTPKQRLAAFGVSNVYYYLVTEPAYAQLMGVMNETVVREGRVVAERPRIITPSYLVNLFEGFEHGREYAKFALQKYGPHEAGLLYQYKNELKEVNIVSHALDEVVDKLNEKLDREEEPLAAIIKGVDEMWDISLLKFIHDLTKGSLRHNIIELSSRGLLDIDRSGVSRDARLRIEELFERVKRGEAEPFELKVELDRWGLFEEYEDRFLSLFGRR